MSRLFFGALLLGSLMTFGAATRAEEVDELEIDASSPVNQARPQARDDSWYYHPSTEPTVYKPNPKLIVQQKALVRSQQRADRIAAMDWYGMSNSRPTAQPTPFCSMYSPAWQSGTGRPFSWNQGRPTYIFR
jgi:hypothetical protein